MLRITDRLDDTPGGIVTELGETLRRIPLGVALTGEATRFTGPMRSLGYRWFADPSTRELYAPAERDFLGRMFVSGLREQSGIGGPHSRAAQFAELLLAESDEFRQVWERHEVGLRPHDVKRFVHPELGELELSCQRLLDPDSGHSLLVYTAAPGSESYEKLQLLAVIGAQALG